MATLKRMLKAFQLTMKYNSRTLSRWPRLWLSTRMAWKNRHAAEVKPPVWREGY